MNKSSLSESDICDKFIRPAMERSGWNGMEQIYREYPLRAGRVVVRGRTARRDATTVLRADYALFYKTNIPIAVVEAKDNTHAVGAGMAQAIRYGELLDVPFSFSSNGDGFVFRDATLADGVLERTLTLDEFPSPADLWARYCAWKGWTPEVRRVTEFDYAPSKTPRYYQLQAINRTVEAIARGRKRVLLVMATGTGKTYTAFQIIWRLWKSGARKRILFLADRNILIDQTMVNDFRPFKGAMAKLSPNAKGVERVDAHFDLLLDRPEAVDVLEQTILQLAVRGVLVPQDAVDEPAGELLERGRVEKDRLVARGIIKPFKPLAAVSDDDHPYELPCGWTSARLGSIGITSTGGTPPTSRPECFGGEIAFIGPGQISARGQILTAEKYISELGRQETSIAESGDLLMVCIGGSIGKCAMVQRATAFNQQINSIRFLFGSSTYLLIAMRSLDFQRQVLATATGSATPIISKGKWDTLLVPVPPLAEQARIVDRVTELRRLSADLRQRLAASQATQSRLAGALVESVVSV